MECKVCQIEEGSLQELKLLTYEGERFCPSCLVIHGLTQMSELFDSKLSLLEIKNDGLEKENEALRKMLKKSLSK